MELMCCSSNTKLKQRKFRRLNRFESLRQQLKIAGDAAASQSPTRTALLGTETQLSQLIMLHELLNSKIEAVKMDAQLPKNAAVQIVDSS